MCTKERRYTNLLCEYWNKVKGDRNFPDLSEIEVEHLSDIWDYCFVIKYSDGKYQVEHVGESIINPHDHDFNLTDIPIIQLDNIENIQYFLDEVLESREPCIEQSEWYSPDGILIKFRQCFLPLGSDENTINAIIGAVRYKIY